MPRLSEYIVLTLWGWGWGWGSFLFTFTRVFFINKSPSVNLRCFCCPCADLQMVTQMPKTAVVVTSSLMLCQMTVQLAWYEYRGSARPIKERRVSVSWIGELVIFTSVNANGPYELLYLVHILGRNFYINKWTCTDPLLHQNSWYSDIYDFRMLEKK